jgi:hypothetical protein
LPAKSTFGPQLISHFKTLAAEERAYPRATRNVSNDTASQKNPWLDPGKLSTAELHRQITIKVRRYTTQFARLCFMTFYNGNTSDDQEAFKVSASAFRLNTRPIGLTDRQVHNVGHPMPESQEQSFKEK